MKAVVVGSGGWGTALSMVLCDNGHDVTLWSHDPAKAAQMAAEPGKLQAEGRPAAGGAEDQRRPGLPEGGGAGDLRARRPSQCGRRGRKSLPI